MTVILTHVFSTADLPEDQRYEAWRGHGFPRAKPIYRTDAIEPFNCELRWGRLGPVAFGNSDISATRRERRIDDIRRCDFDDILISMVKSGTIEGDFNGRTAHVRPGTCLFQDGARPVLNVSSRVEARGLAIPRSLALEYFGNIDDLHGLVTDERTSAIMFAHAESTFGLLASLDQSSDERLGRVFLELAAVVLSLNRHEDKGRVPASISLRHRAVYLIDFRLGLMDVSIESLCRELGVSKGSLFAAFRPDGGIHSYIMKRRLQRVRTALAEPGRKEPIGLLAHRFGFSDPAHLSRVFKKQHGLSPSEFRAAADGSGGTKPSEV